MEAALACIESFARQPSSDDVDMLLFPECFLQGYLVKSRHLSRYALDLTATSFQAILDRLSSIRPTLVFGLIERRGAAYFNTAVVVKHGALQGFYRKTHLVPGERLFQAGDAYTTFNLNGVTCGINICYDTNFPEAAKAVAARGARVLLVPSQNMMKLQTAETWKSRHHAIRAERVEGNRHVAGVGRRHGRTGRRPDWLRADQRDEPAYRRRRAGADYDSGPGRGGNRARAFTEKDE